MKHFQNYHDLSFCILIIKDIVKKKEKRYDENGKEYVVEINQIDTCTMEAAFFKEKPEVNDIITAIPFGIDQLIVTDIIENRDAKITTYPITVDKVKYSKEDICRKGSENVVYDPKMAWFKLKLGQQ
jgi:hypothetical protein